MTIELQSVTFEAQDPRRAAEFWGAVLSRSLDPDSDGILLTGGPGQVGVRFVDGPPHGTEKNKLHLHLSEADRTQWDTIEACLAAGGRLLGNGHVPENDYAVLADAAGDEFCVIEDGNSYLAGCGPLGEITCEGTRAVGLFWGRALGWPLVWEEGEETAIQSPVGGTKIAWSGDPLEPRDPADRQYFFLTVPSREFDEEVGRLTSLGATVRNTVPTGEATMGDPDGNKFVVRAT
jgi:Glyoxalase-like domain